MAGYFGSRTLRKFSSSGLVGRVEVSTSTVSLPATRCEPRQAAALAARCVGKGCPQKVPLGGFRSHGGTTPPTHRRNEHELVSKQPFWLGDPPFEERLELIFIDRIDDNQGETWVPDSQWMKMDLAYARYTCCFNKLRLCSRMEDSTKTCAFDIQRISTMFFSARNDNRQWDFVQLPILRHTRLG